MLAQPSLESRHYYEDLPLQDGRGGGEGQFLNHPRSSIFSHSHNSLTSCAYSETKTFLTTIMRNSQALKKNMASKAKLKIFRNN